MKEEIKNKDLKDCNSWHWLITAEDIEKLKNKDLKTLNNVYMKNYDKFKKCAFKYCYKHQRLNFIADCVNQIYVDLFSYDFSNSLNFYMCLWRSFHKCSNYDKCLYSLNALIFDDDGIDYQDMIPYYVDFDDSKRQSELTVISVLDNQKQLNSLQKDRLLAYAFNCRFYVGMFEYEKKILNKVYRLYE